MGRLPDVSRLTPSVASPHLRLHADRGSCRWQRPDGSVAEDLERGAGRLRARSFAGATGVIQFVGAFTYDDDAEGDYGGTVSTP